MEVTSYPCHSSSFIFSSEAPASELRSPRGRWAGSQARPKLGEVGQPQAEDPGPPYLTVHSPQASGEGPGHKKDLGRGGGKRHPTVGPPTKQGGSSPRSRDGTSQELQSIPLDRVRKRGKKGAASGLRAWGDRERSGKERKKQTGDETH